ncbi:hypothetical protein LLE49_06235 [Alicyclobacillus tolerans]|uniref:hypothetical protein n=1 Tax=Alicyclobacillus tolerans TaxID=90970 RepID=UPI001F318A39|nr:hypothetical protein [Alicyclobacillus tolerans]MCF8564342.1 hypothetical protein [Alicyclobacillus tolerans]
MNQFIQLLTIVNHFPLWRQTTAVKLVAAKLSTVYFHGLPFVTNPFESGQSYMTRAFKCKARANEYCSSRENTLRQGKYDDDRMREKLSMGGLQR